MKTALIFDMDGVLVNSEQFYFDRRMAYFRENGVRPGSSDIHDYLGMSNEQVWATLVPDTGKRRVLHDNYHGYEDSHPINYRSVMNQGVPELLQFLKQNCFQLALASAGIYPDINRMLRECGIEEYFDLVLSGEAVASNKPAPDIYLQAVRELDKTAAECLVIEDSVNGITAAKRAGIETWAIDQSQFGVNQSLADRIVPNMFTVQLLLEKQIHMGL